MIIQINKCEEIGQIIKFIPWNVGPDECISENESKYEYTCPILYDYLTTFLKDDISSFSVLGTEDQIKAWNEKSLAVLFSLQKVNTQVFHCSLMLFLWHACVCVYAQTHTHISVIIFFIYNYQTADLYRAVTKSV